MQRSAVVSEVARAGWAVVDLLDRNQVRDATVVWDGLDLEVTHGFFAPPAMAWGPVAMAVDRKLKELVKPAVERVLPGFRAFIAATTSKGAGSATVIPFHQDWTYTDERVTRAVFLWCPLVDVDESNGALSVVPGSHRWSEAVRPSRTTEASDGLQAGLEALSQMVPMRAGQALAFDPATFHGSGPNLTDAQRPALTLAFVEEGSQLVHFHESDDGELEGFQVDDAFFTQNPYRSRPRGYPVFDPDLRAVSAADLSLAMNAYVSAGER